MVIIVPSEIDGLSKIESNIDTLFNHIATDTFKTHSSVVNLLLPKFKLESKMDLKTELKKVIEFFDNGFLYKIRC